MRRAVLTTVAASLVVARAAELTVSIVYDDSGRFCSTYGFAVPVAIQF